MSPEVQGALCFCGLLGPDGSPSLTQVKTLPPVWADVFADPSLPLHVDIGCAQGRFLLTLAKRSEGAANFLGLEIRSQVKRATFTYFGARLRSAFVVQVKGLCLPASARTWYMLLTELFEKLMVASKWRILEKSSTCAMFFHHVLILFLFSCSWWTEQTGGVLGWNCETRECLVPS